LVWFGMVWYGVVWCSVVVAMSGCRKRFITLQPRSHHGTRAYILVTSEKGLNAAPSASSCTRQQNYFTKKKRWSELPFKANLHYMACTWNRGEAVAATISSLDAVDAVDAAWMQPGCSGCKREEAVVALDCKPDSGPWDPSKCQTRPSCG
jgi:hypothetical protein